MGRNPCEVAGDPIELPNYGAPTGQIRTADIEAAGLLMFAHQLVDRLYLFDAVRQAFALLDTDCLSLDVTKASQADLVNRLACWPEREARVDGPQLAQIEARVLGIANPGVDESERDGQIHLLLGEMLDAIIAASDPAPFRTAVTKADLQNLVTRTTAVQARLSSTVTGLVGYRVRELQVQLSTAQKIVEDIAPFVDRTTSGPGFWEGLAALVGPRLRADGTDLLVAADIAVAWNDVFTWLSTYAPSDPVPDIVTQAAALLRSGSPRTTTATVTTS